VHVCMRMYHVYMYVYMYVSVCVCMYIHMTQVNMGTKLEPPEHSCVCMYVYARIMYV
jgi:hypothetical protein